MRYHRLPVRLESGHEVFWVEGCKRHLTLSESREATFVICFCFSCISRARCSDCRLPSTEKAICYVCASSVDSGLPLLAVSTPAGLVEILRQDACLVRLQRFSVVPSPPGNSGSPRITGLLMVARPAWLLGSQTAVGASTGSNASDPLEILRPLKRHLGWQVEDLLYLQLPNLKRVSLL